MACRIPPAPLLRGVQTEKAHTITAIDYFIDAALEQRQGTSLHRRATERETRKDRLEVGVAQPGARREFRHFMEQLMLEQP